MAVGCIGRTIWLNQDFKSNFEYPINYNEHQIYDGPGPLAVGNATSANCTVGLKQAGKAEILARIRVQTVHYQK